MVLCRVTTAPLNGKGMHPIYMLEKITPSHGGDFVGPQFQHDNWPLQSTQWKLAAALAPIKWYSFNYSSNSSIFALWGTLNKTVFATACVFDPFVLLSGPIQVHLNVTSHLYEVSCTACTLSHCVNSTVKKNSIMILKQSAFAWFPLT